MFVVGWRWWWYKIYTKIYIKRQWKCVNILEDFVWLDWNGIYPTNRNKSQGLETGFPVGDGTMFVIYFDYTNCIL